MAYFCRYLSSLLALACAVRGPAAASEGRTEREFNFTVFSAEPVRGLTYHSSDKAPEVPLCFYPTARSPRYFVRGTDVLQFLDAATGVVAAKVNVPRSVRSALLILSANDSPAENTRRFAVQLVDDSVLQHGAGTLLILNLSGLELRGTINRRPVVLQPGSNVLVQAGTTAAITLRTPYKERTYQAYAEAISLESAGRALLLLLPPYRLGSLEVQSRVLLDTPEPEARVDTR